MNRFEVARLNGCYTEIITGLDSLGVLHKGKWSSMLRKQYDNAVAAARVLKDNATATNSVSKKFPSLAECERTVRNGMSDHRLTEQDRHCIGTVWAFIERKLLA